MQQRRGLDRWLWYALLEGLKLAWSRGYRYLKVYLGYVFHDGFWHDFYKDDSTGKFRLYDLIPIIDPQNIVSLIVVKEYLKREWFLDFENTKSFKNQVHMLLQVLLLLMGNKLIMFTSSDITLKRERSWIRLRIWLSILINMVSIRMMMLRRRSISD